MKVKYMGSADVYNLHSNETIGGRMAEPFGAEVEWNKKNNWIVDTDDFEGVDPEFWTVLCEAFPTQWRNIDGYKRIPLNLHQTTFLGMTEGEQMTEEEAEEAAKEARRALNEALEADVNASNFEVELRKAKNKSDLKKLAKSLSVDLKDSMSRGDMEEALRVANSERLSESAAVITSPAGSTTSTTTVGGSTDGAV